MISTFVKLIAISLCIPCVMALGLIVTNPKKRLEPMAGLDFSHPMSQGIQNRPADKSLKMRDGYELILREYGEQSADKPLVIMLHGSGWNGLQFNALGHALAETAHSVAIDLRGHGAHPGRRGDIDYIGQFEDDLADVISQLALKGQKVVLLGHSSGGGLVVRFAGGKYRALVDHAILLAPYLGHRAPTTRDNSGGWAHVLTRRIIGLSMLNMIGMSALNHLPIIQFNFPKEIVEGANKDLIVKEYSYRLNTSYAPRWDYGADIAALPEFSLIVGAEDEAFIAQKYQETMQNHTSKGRSLVIAGESHLSIVDAPETLEAIQEDLRGL